MSVVADNRGSSSLTIPANTLNGGKTYVFCNHETGNVDVSLTASSGISSLIFKNYIQMSGSTRQNMSVWSLDNYDKTIAITLTPNGTASIKCISIMN